MALRPSTRDRRPRGWLPAERADLIHAVDERIAVAGPTFVSAGLTEAAYRHGLALALPEVDIARPTGFDRPEARNIRIPIEGAGKFSEATA